MLSFFDDRSNKDPRFFVPFRNIYQVLDCYLDFLLYILMFRTTTATIMIISSYFMQGDALKIGARVISGMISTSLLFGDIDAHGAVMKQYKDDVNSYMIDYPEDWKTSSGELSDERPVTAFTSPKTSTTSVSVVYTPIPADFSRLTSFGDLRGYLEPKGDGVETQVIGETSKGEKYTLEYISEQKGDEVQPKRHVITMFALRPQSAVFGVTAQALEGADWEDSKEALKSMIASFKY